ncbi:MAG: hypothetical protein QXT46_06290 [Pyrobaculum sp.]
MRLKAPFLRIILRNTYMELEFENIAIFAESRGRKLYAELYINDVGYIYERGKWAVYDNEGNPRGMTPEDAAQLQKLAKRLSTLPKYPVLELLIKALQKAGE